ncbi:MAG: cytochrome c [Bacteroidota bacterium]
MKKIINGIFILSAFLLLLSSCYNDNEYDLYPFSAAQCDSTNVSYSKTIVPIVVANCNTCHSTSNPSGNVITETWSGLSLVANNGKLWGGVNWEPGFVTMPNLGTKLSACDLGKIKNWINQGAPNN